MKSLTLRGFYHHPPSLSPPWLLLVKRQRNERCDSCFHERGQKLTKALFFTLSLHVYVKVNELLVDM